MKNSFNKIIQSRTARIAVGPSAVRGKGHAGVAKAAREKLKSLDLVPFGTKNAGEFEAALNKATEELKQSLPAGARRWGLARKVLNIFLRDCAYTRYLADAYRLKRADVHYELPLDSITAKALKRAAGRGALPTWPGVKHVTPELSAIYQRAAQKEAAQHGIVRMHLDALWWSFSRD